MPAQRDMINVKTLIEALDRGETFRYQFFFSRTSPYSQWWPDPFVVGSEVYPTAEHFMMAEKARLFGDDEVRRLILATPDPAEAKRLGRAVRGFDEATWVREREGIVLRGNREKFGQSPVIANLLAGTGDRILVEASPWDQVWGIGLEETDRRAMDPRRWRGLNLLGFILMRVRDELQGAA